MGEPDAGPSAQSSTGRPKGLKSIRRALDGPPSPLHLVEIFQIRRRLVLAHWHQVAVTADVVVVGADLDVAVVLGTRVFEPDWVILAAVGLGDRPGTGK